MEFIWQSYGIYWSNIIDKIIGYIWQNYGMYWSIGYIKQKLRDVLGKIIGYTGKKLWNTLRDIVVKRYMIYLTKTKGHIG